MNFPLINISANRWNSDELTEYIIFDEFIYTDDETAFSKYYKNHYFIDCDGNIFKPVGKKELAEKWRSWLRFIPNIWKREIIFQPTGKSWSVEKLRNYMIDRVSELKKDEFTEKWITDLKNATDYSDLINGK